jgi:RecB family exonuclease/predicted nucleic acid-binding protein
MSQGQLNRGPAETPAQPPRPAQPAEPSPARSMADGPLPAYESHSSISTYRGCPLRYGFRYVERRPGEVSPGQFAFGNAVHKAFEAFGRARIDARAEGGPEPGRDVLQAAFDRKISSCGLTADEVDEASRRATPVLDRFLAMDGAAATEPVGVELGFGLDLALPAEAAEPATGAASIRFVGFVDRVDRALDGSTVIVDYKTGRPRSQADVDADLQLTAYAFGCARGGLRDPADGAPLPAASRLGLYFADAGEVAWTTRTDAQLAAFEAALVETVGRIRARAFEARPSRLGLPLVRVPPHVPGGKPGRLVSEAAARPRRLARSGGVMAVVIACHHGSHHHHPRPGDAAETAADRRRAGHLDGGRDPRGDRRDARAPRPQAAEPRHRRFRHPGHGAPGGRHSARAPPVALILDTGPLYASLDRSDQDHAACRGLIEAAVEPLVIPAPVLVEVDYWIGQRLNPGVLVALLADIEAGAYRVADLVRADYARVRELCDRYADADIGFVDAAVLAVAERLGERKLATLDRRHFGLLRPRHVDALELVP